MSETASWRERGACWGMSLIPGNEGLFFDDGRGLTQRRYRTALALCADCRVQAECLEYAVELPLSSVAGVWAGLGISGIRKERKRRGLPSVVEPGCGTNAGYARHQRAAEPPCADCLAAHNEYTVTRRRATRGGPEASRSYAAKKANHTRYHVQRGFSWADCSFCVEASA
jgi:hypothetical protein